MLAIEGEPDRFKSLRSFMGSDEIQSLYAGELLDVRRSGRERVGSLVSTLYQSATGTALRRMRYVDVSTYLADDLMPKVDVATMANSLELRAPLLDQELLRFSLGLPDEWLIDRGGGKKILRALVSRYLPLALFERPKQGFSVPLGKWFASSLREAVSRLASSEALLETGWFKQDGIQLLVCEQANGLRDHTQRLFSLLVLDEWLRRT